MWICFYCQQKWSKVIDSNIQPINAAAICTTPVTMEQQSYNSVNIPDSPSNLKQGYLHTLIPKTVDIIAANFFYFWINPLDTSSFQHN